MYDHDSEDRRATLIAGLILFILLAVVIAIASPSASRRGQECVFAAAVPESSVFFVDVSNPVEQINRLAEMGLLTDVAEFMAVLGSRGGIPFTEQLAATLEGWDADPVLRSDLESVASRRAVAVLLATDETLWPQPLLALQGANGADPLGALDSLASWLGLGSVSATESPSMLSFAIDSEEGHRILDGRVAGSWVVLGPPGTGEVGAELAGCLAGWGPCPDSSLATLPEFRSTLARLPEEAPIHGYLNVPQFRAILASKAEPALASLFDATSGIAIARNITVDGIETWATGRFETTSKSDALSRLLAHLAPIGQPLSNHLPDNALATYDLGAAAADIVGVLDRHIETVFPTIHAWLQDVLDEFRAATGLDPELDLLPYLGRGIAVGILPADEGLDGWPLPRPVLVARSTNDEAVRQFSRAWLRWEAGALAPLTQGLLSAMVDSQQVAGAELIGLQLDTVLSTPMPPPSPTVTVTNGLVIVSPLRSAVVEILGSQAARGASETRAVSRVAAVETMWLNLPAWPEAWRRAEGLLETPVLEQILEPGPLVEIARSLMRLLGGFGPAQAASSVTPDGELMFHAAVTRKGDPAAGQR